MIHKWRGGNLNNTFRLMNVLVMLPKFCNITKGSSVHVLSINFGFCSVIFFLLFSKVTILF